MNDEVEVVQTSTDAPAEPAGAKAAPARRRRRRGGRGRGRSRTASEGTAGSDGSGPSRAAEATADDAAGDANGGSAEATSRGAPATSSSQRRRRGGRGRSRPKTASRTDAGDGGDRTAAPAVDADTRAPKDAAPKDGTAAAGTTPSRRRRRRRSGGSKPAAGTATAGPGAATTEAAGPEAGADEADEAAPARSRAKTSTARRRSSTRRAAPARKEKDEAPGDAEAVTQGTVTEAEADTARPARSRRRSKARGAKEAEEPVPTPTAAPTRLSKVRSTRTRTGGRRRREPVPVVKRARDKVMVLTEKGERDQIAVLEDRDLVQHYVTRAGSRSMVGNVYLGRVQNVLPGMEAAFVDVGRGRNAVLYAGEVNYSPDDLVEGRAPRIEQVLKPGQSVVVQVTKDPIGGKGARLTAQVSMPGRYVVLVPNSDVTGISRRLPLGERRRIKAVVKKIRPKGFGLIVRTAADGVTEEDIETDVQRVVREWETIRKRAKKAKAPAVLYEEPEITVRVVRDLFTGEEFKEMVTDSPRIHETVTAYLREVAPDLVERVRLHDGKLPVFEEWHIVEQLHKGLDRKVWLPSGGYLVIERTEAMTVIDVNTGKHVGKSNLEETVVKTNVEAAREVARQLRLRDIGGIIIIDFIDMLLDQNKKLVEDTLREAMAQDRTRSQVFEIGPLGLCEVTRKRVSGGLLESFSETCPTCEGRGILVTHDF